jgi:uncharacterized YccA/Bax inhibitor family protein
MTVGTPGLGRAGTQTEPSNPALNSAAFERGLAQAGAAERVGMTVRGTYVKTGLLLIVVLLAAAFGWSQVKIVQVGGSDVAVPPSWAWLAVFLTFILGIAGAFAYRSAAIIGPLYALCEGALLGVVAHYFDLEYDGIVLQAVVATLAVFAATLLLYSVGLIKVTSRMAMGVSIALAALALVWTLAWFLSLFGVTFHYLYAPTPLGILLSLGIVILGALTLPINFEFVRQAAAGGSPKFMEWYAAFGLMLSLIWMYVSILRLLALLRAARG